MKLIRFTLVLYLMVVLVSSCALLNRKPNPPSNPSPEDDATNVPIDVTLRWNATDPDGDPLTFDVYFGTDPDPTLVAQSVKTTSYTPGTLDYLTTYYWKVVAKDDHGNETEGPVWKFTTMEYINWDEKISFEVLRPNEIRITNSSPYTVSIMRNLAFSNLAKINLKGEKFIVDTVPFDGTEYNYEISFAGTVVRHVSITTPQSHDSETRGPLYTYEQVRDHFYNFDELIYIDPESDIYEITIHGVRVKVAFFPDAVEVLPKNFRERIFTESVRMFHRHWSMYRGFPTKEYRVIFWYRNDIPPGSESFVACHYLRWYIDDLLRIGDFRNLEPLSHGIGHAWMGGAISITEHKYDVWWLEGIDHYNGIITLDNRMDYFNWDVNYVKNSPYRDLPLIEAGSLFGSPYAYLYYAKGGLFFYLVTKRLEQNGKSWKGFMEYLYDRYFLSENHRGQDRLRDDIRLDTEKLLNDLNAFSGLDFSDLFEKYVYGDEDITEGLVMEEEYLPDWDF